MTEKQELKQAWGQFLDELAPWEFFLTMTFRDPKDVDATWTRPGFSYANKSFRQLIHWLQPPLGEVQYAKVMELQRWRGAPHIHALLAGCADLSLPATSAYLWRNCGFNRILPYDRQLGASYYIAKYITKDIAGFDLSDTIHPR